MTGVISDASHKRLSSVVGLARVCVFVGAAASFYACGQEFKSIDSSAAAGEGGQAAPAGNAAGADGIGEAGAPVAGGGGSASNGGNGGANAGSPGAGTAGVLPMAGAGVGGSVLQAPTVPQESLELWFDAEVGVTHSSDGVSIWKDRSANGRDAVQTSVEWMPTLEPEGLGKKPSVVFDGKDDFLKLPALPGDFSAGVSIFVVGQTDGASVCMGYFEASNGPEVDDVHLGFWQERYLYEVAQPYLHVDLVQMQGVPELFAAIQQQSGDVQVRRNHNVIGESTFDLPVTGRRRDVYLGKTDYAECTTLHGRISELLVYSRGVSDIELLAIESYLQKKWACCTK